MKIYNDYEKNLSLYESITRSRKRSIYFYFIIASIFVIFLFFCPQAWYFYATFGVLSFGFYMLMIVTIYYLYFYPKKVTIFNEILDDYKEGKIIKELNRRGLKKEQLDCVISPYRYIRIAYIHDDNIYTEVRIESTRHGYSAILTPDFVKNYSKKEIITNFKNLNGKFSYEDNKKELSKKAFYNWTAEIFKNEEIIEQLSSRLNEFLDVNKEN